MAGRDPSALRGRDTGRAGESLSVTNSPAEEEAEEEEEEEEEKDARSWAQ